MPTEFTPTDRTPTPRRIGLGLDEGPIADALRAMERALADVEDAKAAVTSRRPEFARAFHAAIATHAGDPSFHDDLQATIAELYWDVTVLRVSDLSVATGLDNERIRRMAGPRVAEVACGACGARRRCSSAVATSAR